jgi:hypothetical protein
MKVILLVLNSRDLIMDSYLVQHVKSPTRENNVLTSQVGMVDKVEVIEHLVRSL